VRGSVLSCTVVNVVRRFMCCGILTGLLSCEIVFSVCLAAKIVPPGCVCRYCFYSTRLRLGFVEEEQNKLAMD